ncbi:MAG: tRNA 2-selenouridine(34) synthase MnmH [Tenuifilaceae bacterium]
MKSNSISIQDFLIERERIPIIDVRSPSEYIKGHIPGAFNVPLFSDEERSVVGTKYVQESRYNSVLSGLDFVGPKLSGFVESASKIAVDRKVLVYCWRGGMRSASMSWLFNLAGIHSKTLTGGYKSYRRYLKECMSKPLNLVILGGMTGSGKTELLNQLSLLGQQVIDLEGLANHKGSAFGAIGQKPQPSSEYFENLLFEEVVKLDSEKHIWVEDESKGIGSAFISDEFHLQMINSPVIAIELPLKDRVKRLSRDYTGCNPQLLIDSTNRISKKLGNDNAKKAIEFINAGDFESAIEITLRYYDKTYRFGLESKKKNPMICHLSSDNIEKNASMLIEKMESLVKAKDPA